MELTETERLMLVGKKDEIRTLSEELLDLVTDSKTNEIEIKKKITGTLSLISTIASYSKSKNYKLDKITDMANMIYRMLSINSDLVAKPMVEVFCNVVNSIRFNFTKNSFKIIIPKIDFSLFKSK